MKKKETLTAKATCLGCIIFIAGVPLSFCFQWLPIWSCAMASLAIAIAVRQFLVGKVIDIFASFIIFGALAVFNYPSRLYFPLATLILLIIGGFYLLIRCCFVLYAIKTQPREEQPIEKKFPEDISF